MFLNKKSLKSTIKNITSTRILYPLIKKYEIDGNALFKYNFFNTRTKQVIRIQTEPVYIKYRSMLLN